VGGIGLRAQRTINFEAHSIMVPSNGVEMSSF